jgi:hypothetical protein
MNQSLFGLKIQICPTHIVPKIKLGDAAPVSDKFRAAFNAWLLDMFGTRDLSIIPRGQIYRFGNTVLVRPEDIAKISQYCDS